MDFVPRSKCERCGQGNYHCYCTFPRQISEETAVRIRYYRCVSCGHIPEENKTVTPEKRRSGIRMDKFRGKSSNKRH